ncbi:MAG TPA: PilZ domain-containing protein [Terriglobales bacterium]|nr:PilZ domain-containing protein [Terriglobales bacterium]
MSDESLGTSPAYIRNRRYTRHRLDARIQLSVFRDGATVSIWGRTSELGQDGVGATLSAELKVGEVVSLEFPIPVPPYHMRVRGIARYCEGLRCGFEFLIVTEDQREILRRTCEVLSTGF